MTKATETFLFLGLLSAVWLVLYLGVIPLSQKVQTEIVPVLPWWTLVSFGSYALFALGYDVLTFNDKPEKYAELQTQIIQAKKELKARGVSITE